MQNIDLAAVKNYLNITYELDDDATAKLTGILTRSETILSRYAGSELVGTEDEQQLLLDLCRYVWNDAYEDFKINFAAELMMLRADYQSRPPEMEA